MLGGMLPGAGVLSLLQEPSLQEPSAQQELLLQQSSSQAGSQHSVSQHSSFFGLWQQRSSGSRRWKQEGFRQGMQHGGLKALYWVQCTL